MTLRDFSSKYNIPLGQVKAAVGAPKGRAVDIDCSEEELILEVTRYYLVDMRFCIERAARDNEMLKKLAERMPSV